MGSFAGAALGMVGSSLIGGIASNQAADTAASGQRYAAKLQLKGQREAREYQEQMYDRARGDFQPYMQFGQQGISQYGQALGGIGSTFQPEGYDGAPQYTGGPQYGGGPQFSGGPQYAGIPGYQGAAQYQGGPQFGGGPQYGNMPQFQAPDPSQINMDPSYQFRLNQGMEATTRALTKSGQAWGGQRGIALMDYAQQSASQEYQNIYNRAQQTYGAQRQAAVQDYGLQRERALQNYGIRRDANVQDYQLTRQGQVQDYQLARQAGVQDYSLQRERALQNYGIQRDASVQDYQLARQAQVQDYGLMRQGYQQDFANQYGVQQDYLNRLQGQAQMGYNATAALGQIGSGTAANVGNTIMQGSQGAAAAAAGAANAQAAGQIGVGNAIGGAMEGIGMMYSLGQMNQPQGGIVPGDAYMPAYPQY